MAVMVYLWRQRRKNRMILRAAWSCFLVSRLLLFKGRGAFQGTKGNAAASRAETKFLSKMYRLPPITTGGYSGEVTTVSFQRDTPT